IEDREDRRTEQWVPGRAPLDPRLGGRAAKERAADVPSNERDRRESDKHERADGQRGGGWYVERSSAKERGAPLEEIKGRQPAERADADAGSGGGVQHEEREHDDSGDAGRASPGRHELRDQERESKYE